jgi:hypothetical protein
MQPVGRETFAGDRLRAVVVRPTELPRDHSCPDGRDQPEEDRELRSRLEVGHERHEEQTAHEADQRPRDRAAHDRSRNGEERTEAAGHAFEAAGWLPREGEHDRDLGEDEARDPPLVPDPRCDGPG